MCFNRLELMVIVVYTDGCHRVLEKISKVCDIFESIRTFCVQTFVICD